jgi:hypothetical protein
LDVVDKLLFIRSSLRRGDKHAAEAYACSTPISGADVFDVEY